MADAVLVQDTQSRFTPHPEGQFPAVCVDVINLGERLQTFGGKISIKPKLALVFRTGQRREDGEFFEIAAEFTASLHDKAGLRQFMESWRGKAYTPEQIAAGVQVDKMEGAKALLSIMHHTAANSGRVYGKIQSVMRLPAGLEVPDTGKYQRAEYWGTKKEAYAAEVKAHRAHHAATPHDDYAAPADDDADLPF